MKPVHQRLDSAPRIALPTGEAVKTLLNAAQTDNALSVAYYTAAPNIGPPLHMHANEDETFYILEGEVTFRAGDATIVARAGDTVFAPRGVPHTFKNRTPTPAHMLLMVTPPRNFETFYARTFGPDEQGRIPTLEQAGTRMQTEGPKAGIQILGPNPL